MIAGRLHDSRCCKTSQGSSWARLTNSSLFVNLWLSRKQRRGTYLLASSPSSPVSAVLFSWGWNCLRWRCWSWRPTPSRRRSRTCLGPGPCWSWMCCGALSHLPPDNTTADQKHCSLGQPRHLQRQGTGNQQINVNNTLKIKTNREIKSYRQYMWYYGLENHSLTLVKYPSEQQQRQEVNAWSQTSDDFWRANRLCWCYTWKAFWDSLLCQHIYLSKAESRKSCATSPGCNSWTCECLLSASKIVYH